MIDQKHMKTRHLTIISLTTCLLAFSCSSSRNEQSIVDQAYVYAKYQEPDDPDPIKSEYWKGVPATLQASFGSIDERYDRSVPPTLEKKHEWGGVAWRGERVSAQMVLWSAAEMGNITFKVNALKSSKGHEIKAAQVQARFVRYLLTDEFAGGCGYRKKEDFSVSLVPDAIDEVKIFEMKERTTRPIWVTIDVPGDAEAGIYTGEIEVISENGGQLDFNISLEVQKHVLPPPKEWAYHLDLWQNPYAVARYHQVEPWSKAHFARLKPLIEMLANAGQKCVTTSIINKPWDGQSQDPFESMIKWTKKIDGTWEYDYSIFDKWVEFAQQLGITEQINCYSMVPWKMSFTYFDQANNTIDTLTARPGTEEYTAHWEPFLRDFTDHLKTKEWFEITTIAMDERPTKVMQEVIALIKKASPDFKIALAGGYHEEIVDDIFDLSVASRNKVPDEVRDQRIASGKSTTYYTCCTEAYPNNFSFSPPAEGVWQGWHAAAKGYSGYLRWAYNSWVEEPLIDSRFRTWPAGDTYLVYPEARTSIRFERMREGIQDYEKIRILKQRLKAANESELLNQLDAELNKFDISNLSDTKASEMINQGKALINQISKNL